MHLFHPEEKKSVLIWLSIHIFLCNVWNKMLIWKKKQDENQIPQMQMHTENCVCFNLV